MQAELKLAGLAPSTPAAAVKAAPLALHRKMDVEQAFRSIMRNCLEQVAANQAGVADGRQPEALHQMRVGLRRLRSAFSLFRRQLQLPPECRQELDWLSGELAAARDWDVLSGATLPQAMERLPGDHRLLMVQLAAESRADDLRAAAAAAVLSERYSALLLNLTRWEHGADWRDACTMQQLRELGAPVGGYADALLKQAQRRLLKRGDRLERATPEARHRVRIAAKKTRYAAEFFASLYRRKRVRPFIRALTALQDELGRLNDGAVAERLLKTWRDDGDKDSDGNDAQLDSGAAFLRGYLAAGARGDDRTLRKLWAGFTQTKLPD